MKKTGPLYYHDLPALHPTSKRVDEAIFALLAFRPIAVATQKFNKLIAIRQVLGLGCGRARIRVYPDEPEEPAY